MPTYKADLHMHVDYDETRGTYHGEEPRALAKAIVNSGIDLFALTEHHAPTNAFFDVEEEVKSLLEVERKTTGVRREIWGVLGAEFAVIFENRRYHIGYLYEEMFSRGQIPEQPKERRMSVREFKDYIVDYPGVSILNHPTWQDKTNGERSVTKAFMEDKLIDGVEIVNGSVLLNGNGKGHGMTVEACKLFKLAHTARPRLAAIGSSDAHRAHMVGTIMTEYGARTDPLDIFDAIKRGQTKVVPAAQKNIQQSVWNVVHDAQKMKKFVRVSEPKSSQ